MTRKGQLAYYFRLNIGMDFVISSTYVFILKREKTVITNWPPVINHDHTFTAIAGMQAVYILALRVYDTSRDFFLHITFSLQPKENKNQ